MDGMPWLDRMLFPFAPEWVRRRVQARAAATLLARHYEGAARGRRTDGWNRSSTDANAANGPALERLRDVARDLTRNNPFAANAVEVIADHIVGWGIVGKPERAMPAGSRARARALWTRWAETTQCDADGRHDFYGLQKLVMRTVIESGEVLVRRRIRVGFPEAEDLAIPMQLQVLEPDFIDTTKEDTFPNGAGRIIQGVEFDNIGRRRAYWLFPEHPGSANSGRTGLLAGSAGQTSSLGRVGLRQSERVPASEILHVFKAARPGQVRGISWFAPVMLRLKDFDEYEDAALLKQKIAACLAVLTTDVSGTAPAVGGLDSSSPQIDTLEPGMILTVPPGRQVSVVNPPTISEHSDYAATTLRAIATGLGMTYEDLTGDYAGMPFSAARMSRLRYWTRVHDWQWRLLIPQFCDPVWSWAMQIGRVSPGALDPLAAEWTAPPAPMIEPDREGLAYTRLIRAGLMTLSEALRERGYDPDETLRELKRDFELLDRLGLVLDCDPRHTTQAGQPTQTAAPTEPAVTPEEAAAVVAAGNGNGNGRHA